MALDFPSSPTNGQVYGNYYYNSARGAWNALLPAATPNFFTGAVLNSSTLVDATATSSLISTTPITIRGIAGQTANLQEWEDSTGIILASITSTGTLNVNTSGTGVLNLGDGQISKAPGSGFSFTSGLNNVSYIGLGTSGSSSPKLNISTGVSTNLGLVIRGAASQTADLQQWQSSTGAVLSEINSAGELQVPRIGVGSVMPTTTRLFSSASAATEIPIIARGAASQTASLQEWQNSGTTVLATIESNGSLRINNATSGQIFRVNNDDTAGVEIGRINGAASNPYIDFHSGTTATDYDVRLYSTGGNGAGGGGTFGITANTVSVSNRLLVSGQPSFMAWRTTGTAVNNTVIYDNVQHNIGGHYNTTNGRFTAPVAGKYHFSINSIGNVTGGTIRLTVRKNGSRTTIGSDFQLRIPVTANYNQGSLNFVWELAANDYIDIYVTEGTEYSDGSAYSNWSGYLIG